MLLVSVYCTSLFYFIDSSFSSFCVLISLCVASVVLALVFLSGLYSAAYRAASLAQLAEERVMWLPFVFFFCFVILFVFFVSC